MFRSSRNEALGDNEFLMEVVREGNTFLLYQLLGTGHSFDFQDSLGRSPLMEAIRCHHFDIAMQIALQVSDVTKKDSLGNNAMSYLCRLETTPPTFPAKKVAPLIQLFDLLRERGQNMNEYNHKEPSYFDKARESKNWPLVSHMLKEDVFLSKNELENLVLDAASFGLVDVMDRALQKGCNINAQNFLNRTPLMEAVSKGHFSAAIYLIKQGADVTLKDSVDRTALDILLHTPAKYDDHINILIKNDLFSSLWKIESKNKIPAPKNRRRLLDSILSEHYTQAIFLLNKGIRLSSNEYANTLHALAKTKIGHSFIGFTKIVGDFSTLLYKMGQPSSHDVFTLSNILETGLQIKTSSILSLAKKICTLAPNLQTQNADGNTPFMEAIRSKNFLLAQIFLQNGADLHIKNAKGETPLSLLIQIPDHPYQEGENKSKAALFLAMEKKGLFSRKNAPSDLIPKINDLLELAYRLDNGSLAKLLIDSGARLDMKVLAKNTEEFLTSKQRETHSYLLEKISLPSRTLTDKEGLSLLSHTALYGNSEQLNVLLSKGFDVNQKDKYGKTPLFYAVQKKDLNMLKTLIASGANLHVRDRYKKTVFDYNDEKKNPSLHRYLTQENRVTKHAFHALALFGKTITTPYRLLDNLEEYLKKETINITLMDMVQIPYSLRQKMRVLTLLQSGANINFQDASGKTPLMKALECGNIKIASFLLEKNARVRIKDHNGTDALGYFSTMPIHNAHSSKMEMAALFHKLIEKGANLKQADNQGESLVQKALKNKHPYPLVLLLEHDAPASSSDYEKALFHAAKTGNFSIINPLLDRGIRIDSINEFGRTPLMEAILRGQLHMASFLLQKGINVQHKDGIGNHAIQLLCALPKSALEANDTLSLEKLFDQMVDLGADLTVKNALGDSLWSLALKSENFGIGLRLIQRGYDAHFDLRDADGQTPLMKAALIGNIKDAQQWIQKGADLMHVDRFGKTCLDYAILNQHHTMASILMAHEPHLPIQSASLVRLQEDLLSLKDQMSHEQIQNFDAYIKKQGGPILPLKNSEFAKNLPPFLNKTASIDPPCRNKPYRRPYFDTNAMYKGNLKRSPKPMLGSTLKKNPALKPTFLL
jgi:uncharacterized protein